MKIGIFTDTYPPSINGVATSIITLQRALEKQGHDVFVVTANIDNISYEVSDKIIKIPGLPTGIYDYRVTGVYPLRVINKIKDWQLDVIHSHSFFTVGVVARIIAKQFKIPLVHTYHTMVEDFTHYIDKKGHMQDISKKVLKSLTDIYCDKTIDELVVPSRKVYNLFKKKYQYNREVHIVPTGIEIDKYHPKNYDNQFLPKLRKKYGLRSRDFVVLYIGRIGFEKSIDFLIDNHFFLPKKAKLLIVGGGPDLEKLQSKVKKLKIDKQVIFTGRVLHEHIGPYYQLGDVFTTASATETQGLTVIEAFAANLPVVAFADSAFEDVVIDDYNGYFFKTAEEYQAIMKKLIQDTKLMQTLKKQAGISAQTFSDQNYANNILKVYRQATQKRKVK